MEFTYLDLAFIVIACFYFCIIFAVLEFSRNHMTTYDRSRIEKDGKLTKSTNFIAYTLIAGLIFGTFSMGILYYGDHRTPKAIDVYRGRTVLEISYIGGIPTDTVVRFNDVID